MPNKIEHLKMIQEIISKFSGYSNIIKSWTISLVTVIITLGFGLNNGEQIKISLFISLSVIILFLVLDMYYYMLERSYRNLYDCVRKLDEKDIDFNMTFDKKSFDSKYVGLLVSPFIGFKSPSISLLYFPLIFINIVLIIVFSFCA